MRETGTKAYFHQPWDLHMEDGEFPTLGVFFVPGMVVWWTTCLDCMPFCSAISSCPMAWRAQRDSPEGRAAALRACPAACVAPPHRSPVALFVPSLLGFALLFSDPPRSPPCPHPILPLPCAVVPVVVSLWLFIGHSPPLSSFCEGKRPQSDGGWRRGLSGPWDWAVSFWPPRH